MRNKRGAAIAVNTIIFLILGIVILVMLILGFTIGFNKLLPFLSSDNVDSVVNGCVASCTTKSVYGFCTQERKLIDSEDKEYLETCKEYSTNDSYIKYGVKKCPTITCPSVAGLVVVPDEQ